METDNTRLLMKNFADPTPATRESKYAGRFESYWLKILPTKASVSLPKNIYWMTTNINWIGAARTIPSEEGVSGDHNVISGFTPRIFAIYVKIKVVGVGVVWKNKWG